MSREVPLEKPCELTCVIVRSAASSSLSGGAWREGRGMGQFFRSVWQKAEVRVLNPAFGTPPKMRRASARPISALIAAAQTASAEGQEGPHEATDDGANQRV